MLIAMASLVGPGEFIATMGLVIEVELCCSIWRHKAAAAEVVNASNSEKLSTIRTTACTVTPALPRAATEIAVPSGPSPWIHPSKC